MVRHHFRLSKINIHKTGPVLQSEPVLFHKIELYLYYLNIHVSTASAMEKLHRNTASDPAFVLDESPSPPQHESRSSDQNRTKDRREPCPETAGVRKLCAGNIGNLQINIVRCSIQHADISIVSSHIFHLSIINRKLYVSECADIAGGYVYLIEPISAVRQAGKSLNTTCRFESA